MVGYRDAVGRPSEGRGSESYTILGNARELPRRAVVIV